MVDVLHYEYAFKIINLRLSNLVFGARYSKINYERALRVVKFNLDKFSESATRIIVVSKVNLRSTYYYYNDQLII